MSLFDTSDTFLSSVPFSNISVADFLPEIEVALADHQREIQSITQSQDPPTFDNTVVPLEKSGTTLQLISSVFFALANSDDSEEMQKVAEKIIPKITAHQIRLFKNVDLFQRVQTVYSRADREPMSGECQTLLDQTYKSFLRNGVRLSDAESQSLESIASKLAQLGMTFGKHVQEDTQSFSIQIRDPEELKGLSPQALALAENYAKQANKKGWLLRLDFPFYLPFMETCQNRSLRKKLFMAMNRRCISNKETQNSAIIKEILSLRKQKAQLLKYPSYPSYVLEQRMLDGEAKVFDFLDNLKEKSLPLAQKDWKTLEQFAQKTEGIDRLEAWDVAHYARKLKEHTFGMDTEKMKEFFPLDQVLSGLFSVVQKLYRITFEETFEVDRYHSDVKTFLVKDAPMALLYLDLFPRVGKKPGAWMTTFRNSSKTHDQMAHVVVVCNFTPETPDFPSLLSFGEVQTLFHEVGHALHAILSDTEFGSLSGTQVLWDFVELPSQIMENWAYEPLVLQMMTSHYKTRETLPDGEILKLRKSRYFMEGYQCLRQTGLAMLDMMWHTQKIDRDTDVLAFENRTLKPFSVFPAYENTGISPSFAHIFQGGYGVGYYSYKWSEVLASDAFTEFERKGIFDAHTADSFRKNILSKGGSDHPSVLYEKFKNAPPSLEPLLRKLSPSEYTDSSESP